MEKNLTLGVNSPTSQDYDQDDHDIPTATPSVHELSQENFNLKLKLFYTEERLKVTVPFRSPH